MQGQPIILRRLQVQASASGAATLRGRPLRPCILVRAGPYDHPALYTNDDTFAEASYWERRYADDAAPFEWYRGFESLRPLITRYLPRELPVLQLGVGTSTIQLDMVTQEGYSRIVSVDFSKVVVASQRAAHANVPQLEYEVADVRDLRDVAPTAAFGGVLDKGTLDALLCGESDDTDSAALLQEVVRVLLPRGVYFHVTHAPPASRLRYLQRPEFGWASIEVWEVGQQGQRHGPHLLPPTPSAAPLPAAQEVYSHMVYVCRKPAAAV